MKPADPRAAWNAVACLARAEGCFGTEAKQHRRLARALADMLRHPEVRVVLAVEAVKMGLPGGQRLAEEAAEQAFQAGTSHQHIYGRGRWEKALETLLEDGPDHWHVRHWRRNSAYPGRAWCLDVERNAAKGTLYKAGHYEEGTPPSTLLWERCDPEDELSMPTREQLQRPTKE